MPLIPMSTALSGAFEHGELVGSLAEVPRPALLPLVPTVDVEPSLRAVEAGEAELILLAEGPDGVLPAAAARRGWHPPGLIGDGAAGVHYLTFAFVATHASPSWASNFATVPLVILNRPCASPHLRPQELTNLKTSPKPS